MVRRMLVALGMLISGCATEPPLPAKAVALNRAGAAALAVGDLTTAEARLAIAIEYSPKFTEAWVNLGLVELSRGELAAAWRDLKRARTLNPDLPTPHHAIGLFEERRGNTKAAEVSYRAALGVDPGFAPARSNLGRLLFDSARYEEAREQFFRLTEIAPDVLDGWLGLAESLLRLGRERDADRTIDRGRRRLGERPELVVLVARQLLRRSAFHDAETLLEPLTASTDPHQRATAWAWLSVARLGDGRLSEAEVAVEESLSADPAQPVARFAQAEIQRQKQGS